LIPWLAKELQVVEGQPTFFPELVLNTVLMKPGGHDPPPVEADGAGDELLAQGSTLLWFGSDNWAFCPVAGVLPEPEGALGTAGGLPTPPDGLGLQGDALLPAARKKSA